MKSDISSGLDILISEIIKSDCESLKIDSGFKFEDGNLGEFEFYDAEY